MGVDEHSGDGAWHRIFRRPRREHLLTRHTTGEAEAGQFTVELGGRKYPARQLVGGHSRGTSHLESGEETTGPALGKSEGTDWQNL